MPQVQNQEKQEVEREWTLEHLAKVIQQMDTFLEAPEHKELYIGENFDFKKFIYDEPETIKHPEFAALIHDLGALSDGLLITSLGQADLIAHRKLKDLCGARVVCVERDSFGWLIGKIVSKNFFFYYG